MLNVSALNNTKGVSNPSCKSSKIIDANTEPEVSYAGPDAADADEII